jgi:L-threonylcarbamoyladenylate synthase
MQLLSVDPAHPEPAAIARAAELLRAGRLVAFPTETEYGLGANALDARAVERIYAAKGRPAYNPLIVHVADAGQVMSVATDWPDGAARLAAVFWPGPLTLVLPKRDIVPDAVTAGLPSVAVRVPSHPVAHALLAAARIPVAAPSANRSMMLSPTTGRHVARSLGESVDLILDAGPTTVGIESTVVDLTGEAPVLLRPGTISLVQLQAVVGPVRRASASSGDAARPSPGMLDRHYSPRAALYIASTHDVARRTAEIQARGQRAGALVVDAPAPDEVITTRLSRDAGEYASRLYAALHELDDAGCEAIIVEQVPDGPEWLGVRDRLARAARSGGESGVERR